MKLISAKIFNYKSFNNKQNYLFISDLNVIVGKNESGKSNLVEALGNVGKIGYTPKSYFDNKNRINNEEVNIELVFKPGENDDNLSGYSDNITLNICNYGICKYDEKFGNYVCENNNIKQIVNALTEFRQEKKIPISKPENLRILNNIFDNIEQLSSKMLVIPDGYNEFTDRLRNISNPVLDQLCNILDGLFGAVNNIYACFPEFLIVKDIGLKSSYNIKQFKDEIALGKESILFEFLDISEISYEELENLIVIDDPVTLKNKMDQFNTLIKNNFVDKFNENYTQEVIDIFLMINNSTLQILIKTKGNYLRYDERSNGLKWYISIFIQLLFRNKNKDHIITNNIILLDEPGVYLHSIAQQELVRLFKNLARQHNQIIYTTHSPSMIDFSCIQDIRAVEKDNDGNSCIYNKLSEFPFESKTKQETITPIIQAMGYQLSFNVGANYQKLNIIVEGITDYFYLSSYLKYQKNDSYNIIASTGANNIPAIASILYGWGCKFIILLDHDSKGRSIYDSINDTRMPYIDKVLFIDGKEYCKTINFEIEDLFSDNDKNHLNIAASDYKERKYFYAYGCLEKVVANELKLDELTISNFEKIFNRIEALK